MVDIREVILEEYANISRVSQAATEAYRNPDTAAEYPIVQTVETDYPESFADPITREPIAPENQPFLLDEIRVNTSRFSGAMWYGKIQEQTIIVGGQGGISSWFTFLAARMFPRSIYTYDPDRVELVNLAGQLFSMSSIGRYKGSAVASIVSEFSDYRSIFAVNEPYTEECSGASIMVCGFDNMAARKVFYNNWRRSVLSHSDEDKNKCLFIDGRLAAESLQILCITGDSPWDMDRYESEFLFDDAEADETVCSFKQTAFMANMIAGMMINMLVNFCANLVGGCRTIPFFTQYEADQMLLRLEGGV